jgi:hypothetical protein
MGLTYKAEHKYRLQQLCSKGNATGNTRKSNMALLVGKLAGPKGVAKGKKRGKPKEAKTLLWCKSWGKQRECKWNPHVKPEPSCQRDTPCNQGHPMQSRTPHAIKDTPCNDYPMRSGIPHAMITPCVPGYPMQ